MINYAKSPSFGWLALKKIKLKLTGERTIGEGWNSNESPYKYRKDKFFLKIGEGQEVDEPVLYILNKMGQMYKLYFNLFIK